MFQTNSMNSKKFNGEEDDVLTGFDEFQQIQRQPSQSLEHSSGTSCTRGLLTAFNNKNRKKSRASSSPTFGWNHVVHDVNTDDGILPPASTNSTLLSQINHSFSTSTGWRTSNQWAVESDDWGTDLKNITASFRSLYFPFREHDVPLD